MSEKMADDFLMSPTVDYCFKELLAYPTVRKGFLAAILNRDPSEIGSTELLPTILEKETEEGKYGILDVRIRMKDGSQIDLEMQVVPFAFWERRILFYLSRMYTEQIKADEKEVYRSFGNLCAGTEETSAGAVEGANDHPVDAVSFGAEEGGL